MGSFFSNSPTRIINEGVQTMCRWVAYAGAEIYLQDIIFDQDYSIVQQSLSARESSWSTNGDGFGVAWYADKPNPGIFKDILPAWHDQNLRSIAGQIKSRLFFTHVRATTGTSVARSNCHPFNYENWLFMHNGAIGLWTEYRKEIESLIDSKYYNHRHGVTDSEALFLVALTEGLQENPPKAMKQAIRKILKLTEHHLHQEPLRISAACTDGEQIWAFRFSSDSNSPSLYFGSPKTHSHVFFKDQINTISSEPSDDDASHWHRVEENSYIVWSKGRVSVQNLGI
jgi:predicted glutamine amidotransferase